MTGESADDDQLIEEFAEDVVAGGHHIISYDPAAESVVVLSDQAAAHIREILGDHACDLCTRINAQLEVQEMKRDG
ncbi:MAG: hypothetical protein DCC49_08140 [Acidobacteria bacterium]|nr:MAG: hypothetical protein DCC49_08140 [Acidobacteriota bacterium]